MLLAKSLTIPTNPKKIIKGPIKSIESFLIPIGWYGMPDAIDFYSSFCSPFFNQKYHENAQ
jgi:hypothetical protein